MKQRIKAVWYILTHKAYIVGVINKKDTMKCLINATPNEVDDMQELIQTTTDNWVQAEVNVNHIKEGMA